MSRKAQFWIELIAIVGFSWGSAYAEYSYFSPSLEKQAFDLGKIIRALNSNGGGKP